MPIRNFVAKHAKRCGAGSHTARKYNQLIRVAEELQSLDPSIQFSEV